MTQDRTSTMITHFLDGAQVTYFINGERKYSKDMTREELIEVVENLGRQLMMVMDNTRKSNEMYQFLLNVRKEEGVGT